MSQLRSRSEVANSINKVSGAQPLAIVWLQQFSGAAAVSQADLLCINLRATCDGICVIVGDQKLFVSCYLLRLADARGEAEI